MRRSFERNLDTLKPMAQDQAEGGWTDADQAELDRVIEYHLQKSAASQHTSVDTQRQIFDLQIEKQRVMGRLKEEIRHLDDKKAQPETQPDSRPVVGQGRTFVCEYGHRGRRLRPQIKKITAGEILTDASWGITYSLDPATVPRNLRKRYYIERAKQKILDLLNLQILQQETTRNEPCPSNQKTYAAILQGIEDGKREKLHGIIAEHMVKNFFKKIIIDHGLDLIIEEVDVHQDVEMKVDFILRRKRYRVRGVGVETHENKEASNSNQAVGIQFTIQIDPSNLARKQQMIDSALNQMRRETADINETLRDLILVTLPNSCVGPLWQQWTQSQCPSGGPDHLWDSNVKETLFREVLKGVFTKEELDERWKNISSAGSSRS